MADNVSEIPLKLPENVQPQPVAPPVTAPLTSSEPLPLTLHPEHPTQNGLTLDAEHRIAEAANLCLEHFAHIAEVKDSVQNIVQKAPGFTQMPQPGDVGNFTSLHEMISTLITALVKIRAEVTFNYSLKIISTTYFDREGQFPPIITREMRDRIKNAIINSTELPSNKDVEDMLKEWFVTTKKKLPKPEESEAWLLNETTQGLTNIVSRVATITRFCVNEVSKASKIIEDNSVIVRNVEEALKELYSYIKNNSQREKYFRLKNETELYPYDLRAINGEWGKYCSQAIDYSRRVMYDSGVISNNRAIAHAIADTINRARNEIVRVGSKYINSHEMLDEASGVLKNFLKERMKHSDFEKVYGNLFKYTYNERGDDLKNIFVNSIIDNINSKPYGSSSSNDKSLTEIRIQQEFEKQIMMSLESGVSTVQEIEENLKELTKNSRQTILSDLPSFAENWLTLSGDGHDKFMELIRSEEYSKASDEEQEKKLKELTATLPLEVLSRIGPSLDFNKRSLQKKLQSYSEKLESEQDIKDDEFISNYNDIKKELGSFKKAQMFARMFDARRSIKMRVARDIGSTFESATNMAGGLAPDPKYMIPARMEEISKSAKSTIINEMIKNNEHLPLRELGEELEKLQLASMRSQARSLDESPIVADMTSLVLRLLTAQDANNGEVYIRNVESLANIHRSNAKLYLAAVFLHDDKFLISKDAPPEERRQKGAELARMLFEFLSKDTKDSDYNDQFDYEDSMVAYRAAFNHAYKNAGTNPSNMVDVAEAFASLVHDNSFTDLHVPSKRDTFTAIVSHPNFKDIAKSKIVWQLLDNYAKLKWAAWSGDNIQGDEDFDGTLKRLIASSVITQNQADNVKYIMDFVDNKKSIDFDRESLIKLQTMIRDSEYVIEAISNSSFTEFMEYHEPKDPMVQKAVEWEQPRFRFRALPDKSPEHFTIGIKTDCCQHLGGAGANAAIDSFINHLAGVLVLEIKDNDQWELAYQSYFHYVPEQHAYILDNVEGVEKYFPKIKKLTGHEPDELYYMWAQQMKSKYPEITYIALGLDYTKIPTSRFATHTQEEDPRIFHDHIADEAYSDYDEEEAVNLLEFKSDLPIVNEHGPEDDDQIVLGGKRSDYVVKISKDLSFLRSELWRSTNSTTYDNFSKYEQAFKRSLLQFLAMHGIKKTMKTPMEEIEKAIQRLAVSSKTARMLYRSKLFQSKMKRGLI